jgi:hypothetical protein
MVIRETNIWGDYHNIRNVNKRVRLMKKKKYFKNIHS